MTSTTYVLHASHRYASYLDHLSSPTLLRALHAHLLASGLLTQNTLLLNRLLHRYSLLGDLPSARHLFDLIPHPDIAARTTLLTALSRAGHLPSALSILHSTPPPMRDTAFYNSAISAHSRARDGRGAFTVFKSMLSDGSCPPNDYTMTTVLSGAGTIVGSSIYLCSQLHCTTVTRGTHGAVSVPNALIALYSHCTHPEAIRYARKVFDEMRVKDELSWATMIVAYVRHHDLVGARRIFDSTEERVVDVAWNAMISGYVQHGCIPEGLDLVRSMCSKGIPLNEFTYTTVLSTCANAGLFLPGRSAHGHLMRARPDFDQKSALIIENALVTLYSKCGKSCKAMNIFCGIREKDIFSWNAMLSGYVNSGCVHNAWVFFQRMPWKNLSTFAMMIAGLAQKGFNDEALRLFTMMREEGFGPCDYVFAAAITACSVRRALGIGQQLHGLLLQSGYESSNSAGNALVTMYARCGVVEEACRVFLVMPVLDSISWNAIIAALAQHGRGHEAIDLFEEMLSEGVCPDQLTFLMILSACNHAGLVDEGVEYFKSMQQDYGLTPGEDHYARLIDLLGRAGWIAEVKEVINSMPSWPGPLIWEAVLSSCRIHRDVDLGIYAAEQLFEMAPQHDGAYVLLSNMYASVGRWPDVARIRKLMKERCIKKQPGCSWIEIAGKVHAFLANDTDHPDGREIYRFLEIIGAKTRKLGHVPDVKFVLHDVESECKEHALSAHSERLAVAFGLLKLPAGAIIRVFKNLRICGDCHAAISFMSLATQREIVVRDGKRFHHFRDGSCSCGNYW